MSTPSSTSMFFERAEDALVDIEFAGGHAVCFSLTGPDKPVNEDALALLAYPEGGLLAVADGMGGQNAGERASRATIECVAASLERGMQEQQPLRHVAVDGIEAANRGVLDLGVGAGSTFAGFVLRESRARPLHVGDSLALHVGQRGKIKAQTIPHSPTGYAVEAGMLDERDAMRHEERHIVSNFVGMAGMRIELGPSTEVAPRDTLLVASDGLTDNLPLQQIVETIRKGPLQAAARRLADLARRRMAGDAQPCKPDDLTFVLFRRQQR